MRLIKSILALCFVVIGVIFGALNMERVRVDLWFESLEGQLGLMLLSAVLLGALIGGLAVTASVVWPLRRRIHRSGSVESGPDSQELSRERNPQ